MQKSSQIFHDRHLGLVNHYFHVSTSDGLCSRYNYKLAPSYRVNSYVILLLASNTVNLWTELRSWRKSYSNNATFLLGRSHHYNATFLLGRSHRYNATFLLGRSHRYNATFLLGRSHRYNATFLLGRSHRYKHELVDRYEISSS
jgi:hypothetical protein